MLTFPKDKITLDHVRAGTLRQALIAPESGPVIDIGDTVRFLEAVREHTWRCVENGATLTVVVARVMDYAPHLAGLITIHWDPASVQRGA